MAAWWATLTSLEQFYAILAIPATVILILQTALLLIGGALGHGDAHDMSADHDVDIHDLDAHDLDAHVDIHGWDAHGDVHDFDTHADAHADTHDWDTHGENHTDGHTHDSGLHLFTLRGIVGFFAVLGWTGLAMLRGGLPTVAAIALSLVFGILSLFAIAAIMKSFLKLQADGTLDLRNAVGLEGSVYLTIPSARSGKGKVTLVVQERYAELDAVTDDPTPIPTGDAVAVISLLDRNTLVVRRK